MTAQITRRENARAIAASLGPHGQAEFGRRLGVGRAYVSSIIGESANPKGIGDVFARKIEATFGKPVGWLDKDHGDARNPLGYHTVPFYDVLPHELAQRTGGATSWLLAIRVSKDWLRVHAPAPFEHLAMVAQDGDEMAPTVPRGATCIVDRSASKVTSSGVYVVHLKGEAPVVRRVQRDMKRLVITCDNTSYTAGPPAEERAVRCLGRVLCTIEGRVI